MTAGAIRELARQCGFELAGVAPAEALPERAWYHEWVASGFAGRMRYLADYRAAARNDPRNLLASARSIVCVGKLYNTPWPYSTQFDAGERAWISRYAWGEDYHAVVRRDLERRDAMLRQGAGEITVEEISHRRQCEKAKRCPAQGEFVRPEQTGDDQRHDQHPAKCQHIR